MHTRIAGAMAALLLVFSTGSGQAPLVWNSIIGSAFTGGQAYRIIERLSDEAGGRLMGTPQNSKGLDIVAGELRQLGFSPQREEFEAPGWERAEDRVEIVLPRSRKLRTVALGYSDFTPEFQDTLIFAGHGSTDDYAGLRPRGKVALVKSSPPPGREPLLRYEVIDIAAAQGVRAVLFINDREGGLLLCGVSNFHGTPAAVPAFSISYEEGNWLERLIGRGIPVTVRIAVRSRCMPVRTENLVARLPGRTNRKIVVGAHIDSWDVGQGSSDNGIGSGVLFDVARLLRTHASENDYTVEFVWFNGEELGLWGAKRYVEQHEDIAAMVNLDMAGSPRGFNAMGFDAAIPLLTSIIHRLPGFQMTLGVQSVPWTNSDFQPFLLSGIPSFGMNGHLDEDDVKYYHDFGDSFDKVNGKYLAEASAVAAILTLELANAKDFDYQRMSKGETINLLKRHKVDERLKRQKQWPFD